MLIVGSHKDLVNKFLLKVRMLQIIAQFRVISVILVFEFFVVNVFENAAAFCQIVCEIKALQYFNIVQSFKWDHYIQQSESKAIMKLI